jgi:hypothetical protein
MRRLLLIVAVVTLSLPLAAQTTLPAPATRAVAITDADVKQYEPLLDKAAYVLVGTITKEDAAARVARIQTKTQIYQRDTLGGFVTNVGISAAEGQELKADLAGVFFVLDGAGGKPGNFTVFPVEQQDKIIAAAEPWLERKIVAQLKTLEQVYKDDPDGDKAESVAAARRMFSLGLNQSNYPTLRPRLAEHPSRGHLAELFKILNADLGIPPYIKTAEDKAKAVEVLKNVGEQMVSSAATRAATRPFPDSDFDQMAAYFLDGRFRIFANTLGADDQRFKSDVAGYAKRLPEGDKMKMTRMNVFKALLDMQLKGGK